MAHSSPFFEGESECNKEWIKKWKSILCQKHILTCKIKLASNLQIQWYAQTVPLRQVVPLSPVYTQLLLQLPACGKVLRISLYIEYIRQKLGGWHYVTFFSFLKSRAEEPPNFLLVPALAPDFFPKRLRLRLLVFFPSGSGFGSWYFFYCLIHFLRLFAILPYFCSVFWITFYNFSSF